MKRPPAPATSTSPNDALTTSRQRSIEARAGSSRKPVLVVLSGPQVGERVAVHGLVEVGRDPRAPLHVRDPGVAFHHLQIEPTHAHDTWIVRDLGNAATFVDGRRLRSGDETPVGVHEEIRIGETVLRVELHDAVEQEFDRIVVERLHVDELTGLYTRRKFELELDGLLEVGSSPITLALVDLDGLKRINDEHGHLAGAAVIASTGRTLARTLGSRGIAARLGGDEFAIALLVPLDQAISIVDGLLEAVAFTPCLHEGRSLTVTMSAGLARGVAGDRIATLRAADHALLDAKQRGGARLVIAAG